MVDDARAGLRARKRSNCLAALATCDNAQQQQQPQTPTRGKHRLWNAQRCCNDCASTSATYGPTRQQPG
eukprot:1593690-Lingulodinium_polyedra.AAC.1